MTQRSQKRIWVIAKTDTESNNKTTPTMSYNRNKHFAPFLTVYCFQAQTNDVFLKQRKQSVKKNS